jgi:hypothetical protein
LDYRHAPPCPASSCLLKAHWVYLPYFLYPFFCWPAPRLIPYLGCCEYWYATIFYMLHFPWLHLRVI